MNLEQFAEKAGVTLIRCDKDWGGTWGYTTKDHPNSCTCGFRTKNSALKGWLNDTFDKHCSKAILSLLDKPPPTLSFNWGSSKEVE